MKFSTLYRSVCSGGIGAIMLLASAQTHASATGPAISLFPTTVVENLRQTVETSKQMEQGLQTIISDMNQQFELYQASKCEGAEADAGCAQIRKQISNSYNRMLDEMEAALPEMERAVKTTTDSLASRLRTEIGRKMTPRDMQRMLKGKINPAVTPSSKNLSQRKSRLSATFRNYHALVARGGNDSSLATLAADIYLDSQEVLQFITLTKDEIARAKIHSGINDLLGDVTPQMLATVNGVKSLLFGEEEVYLIPDTPLEEDSRPYSPWEIQ